MNDILIRALKEGRKKRGLKQAEVAAKIGIKPNTLSGWENGVSEPDFDSFMNLVKLYQLDYISLFQEAYGLKSFTTNEQSHLWRYQRLDDTKKRLIDYLMDFELFPDQVSQTLPQYTELRYYAGRPSAGLGNYLLEDGEVSTIMVKSSNLTKQADFVLRVDGQSMSPKYQDGDLVLVKSQDDVDLDEIGIFVVDGEAFIKQRKRDRLHSLNPAYPDVLLSEEASVKCFGKVLGKA